MLYAEWWPNAHFVFYNYCTNYAVNCTNCAQLQTNNVLEIRINHTFYRVVRPPGTLVTGGLMFYPWCFLFIRRATSELRRPIAVKLCHMIAISCRFIMQVQKFGGPKTCKIRRDFRQLQTSIANISGKGQDIQNRKTNFSRAIPPAFKEKRPVNFGPLTTEN